MSSNPIQSEAKISRDEIELARCDLAAVFRIAAHENLHEGIDNHCSHALSDGTFLVNRGGVHWSQMRCSDILQIDHDGNVLDGDGSVGILDLLALLAAWDTDPGGPPDFDGDGSVGILDLLTLLANWGPCP